MHSKLSPTSNCTISILNVT
uniref:Uncharacterized protein n=1 Tax=Rhizophora mucronata TaxID=61149 RepID=A0A2P2NGV8_RHIMU